MSIPDKATNTQDNNDNNPEYINRILIHKKSPPDHSFSKILRKNSTGNRKTTHSYLLFQPSCVTINLVNLIRASN
ncbi:MAG: hypothetical protein A2700_03205 [Candidatus Blackburnbacteria bacterium RIFCSPHIGHO2_01_FULL_44_64]|uniref:Uncharacterized protein n=1 Tax=Candidatus Blackburnbacteria bacterium RIFCSPHIGHO2_02_FULL_44_20 TaxID=1797516 RepID=A0A1G1V9Q0_9BACT|nr:MAG: hypothetical protein A2700_03205 [Candidatus Blackburnbacteria bacterium RIFCSPHIGHO2_01_FULL_44_64]OGY11516.1 MAG: hypothetical protein A3E16_02600 [Candidatus Blackburnbacteria bacterium RIFCSPHIGHO2_12_FULL_44_25]OGY12184.1 MAG: hypothetical protein A3D26_01200 [Candidatus Blackburnbacteria bacterium RIFCSPHIGHO2_02_FULL_44_20]OGY13854.1 MAG: hypothetical protein A3A62_02040 [Candidatus Blackburnbacteria bacterium RIFCSPLOWO2_01_FULL_44_43]